MTNNKDEENAWDKLKKAAVMLSSSFYVTNQTVAQIQWTQEKENNSK